MDRYKTIVIFKLLMTFCLCEINVEEKAKLVNGFVKFYNSLSNQYYTCDEGYLLNAQNTDIANAYNIEVSLKVSEIHNVESVTYLKCSATVADVDISTAAYEPGISVLRHECHDDSSDANPANVEDVAEKPVVNEPTLSRTPVQLDNEVQTNTAVTSGEQFIAVPREEQKKHCIGCSSHVNPQAEGVSELAAIGIRQLNSLEPNIQHTLSSVIDVERQVQVVNGVRYILTLIVDYNSCLNPESLEPCITSNACKISILEKPWMQLTDGSKFRAILSNNCTEEWRFGDDGVVVPTNPTDNGDNNPSMHSNSEDIIKPVQSVNVQSQQQTQKTLTDEDIKNIQEQIIPNDKFNAETTATANFKATDESKDHVEKVETEIQFRPNAIQSTKPHKVEVLDDDKKKTIDDLIHFFNFDELDQTINHAEVARTKRSFSSDLGVLNIAEKYHKLKKSISNSKHIYFLAQTVVEYMNKVDLEVKNRILKNVINAEMESEDKNHFFYIQFRTIVPCDDSVCEKESKTIKICNAIIDGSEKEPQILNVFCNDENKHAYMGKVNRLSENDPVLLHLIAESIKKIEKDSPSDKALRLSKIIEATTQKVTGLLTKVSLVLDEIDCNKTVPVKLRNNCSVVEQAGSTVCDITIFERHSLKDKDITYSCIDRPADISFSKKYIKKNVNDPKIRDILQEALNHLDDQSNRNNKQVLVSVLSVSTQLVAGFLTTIDFVVGYTTCISGVKLEETYNCKLLQNVPLRKCTVKHWDRAWIQEDENKFEVLCDDSDVIQKQKESSLLTEDVVEGKINENPNDPKYKALAEESLQKYLQDSGNSHPHKLVSIEKVTSQVVAGTLTEIFFKISSLDSNAGDIISCKSKIWEQPWLNKKEIQVNCKIDQATYRNKRSVKGVGPGGQLEVDPNDPKYKALAEESLQKYLQDSGNSHPHKLVSIEKVTHQVVAGTLTEIFFKISSLDSNAGDIISCKSKIWEQPWLNKKEIQVNCKIDQATYRNKRSVKGVVPGGQLEVDPNDPKYKALAEESLQKYLLDSGNNHPHKLVRIVKVTKQVVSGTMTRIDFIISLKSSAGDDIICHSNIWERPWLNKKDITVDCDEDIKRRVKRSIITGGLTEQDPSNPEYRILAEKSLAKYLSDIGNKELHEIVNIQKVTTQVVSGIKTIIEFNIAPKALASNTRRCKSYIWEQPWLNSTEINVDCENDNGLQRNKREIRKLDKKKMVGAIQEEDATKAEFKDLAEESLTKYKKHLPKLKFHVVAEVKKVTTQIVSGVRYTIDFVAAPKTCAQDVAICDDMSTVLYCHSVLKHQPWLSHKEIDVSCNSPYKRKKRRVNLENTKDNIVLNELSENDNNDDDRLKRQADDDDIEDDTRLYYADRAVEHLNTQSDSKNLYKLIALHAVQSSTQMENTPVIRMYIEVAETFCLRHFDEVHLSECEEMDAMNHKLCLARVWPSTDDEMIVKHVSIVCDNDEKFESVSGISLANMIKVSLEALEKPRSVLYKLVHLGEPHLIPSLDSKVPFKLKFIIGTTNCSKNVESYKKGNCFLETTKPSKACTSYIWLTPNSKAIERVTAKCGRTESRQRRSIPMDTTNATVDDLLIQRLVQESLDKLEMATPQRYKQKVLNINSFTTKVTSGKITTIDFDVGFTSCLKYAWVDDVSSCELLEHLPRRRCVSQIWERLWLENGRDIEVTCKDEDEPLEAHVEFESAVLAKALAQRALKYIEAKYPHPRKQKVVRIFSLDKQVVAGVHYRMKVEVATTNCSALSNQNMTHCKPQMMGGSENKFCTVNVWLRPWTDHPPNYRVTCDYQEGAMAEMYHQIQAEHLFREFVAKHMPAYMDNPDEIVKRFEIFRANILKMHELNTHERGTASYGVTRFADLTYEEFTTKYMGLKHSLRDVNQVPMRKAVIPNVDIPNKFDWREQGAVTGVKDQGSCGSCWAFSVTGNIEGQWKLKSGRLEALSEQELVDCDALDDGCNGGLPDNAYRAIEQIGGLETETDYPYEGENDKCTFNKTLSRVQISGAVNISSNETDMAKWLVAHGPISIGINANAMQFYMGGVSHPWKMLCSPASLDHGVLIVGYGVKNYPLFHKRLPYWIVKNSWGASWGEQGYYRVFRGDGTCGLNLMASSAVV